MLVAGILPGIFAAWLGTSLDDPAPYRLALGIAPLVYLLAIWLMAGARPLRTPKAEGGGAATARPWLVLIFLGVVVLLQTAGEGSARAFFNVYLDTGLALEPAQIGATMGIAQVLPIVAALMSPLLMRRFGTVHTLALSSLVIGFAFVVMGVLPRWGVAGLSYAAIISMATVNGTARNIFSQELVSVRWRTTASAVLTIGLALGWATMAAVGGFLIQSTGFRGLFFASAGLAFAGVLVLIVGDQIQQRTARRALHRTAQ